MPKSKRNKQIELAKTKKRGLEWKKRLFEEVRSCVDKYTNVFVFSVSDMRNSKMKNVRDQWKHSRFFIGKNKIMAMALGRFAEEEYKPNLHKVGQQIKGQRGLLFSNKPVEEVLSWFRSYSEGDYARSGNTATETVNLPAGPLTMFPHNQEPYLRQLGLPTSLVKGVIHLIKDFEVCKVDEVLTPEKAKILKLLQYEMAEFHITIDCVWSQDGSFMQLTESIDTGAKENMKKGRKTFIGVKPTESKSNSSDMEEMEVELDEENDSGDSEDENNNITDIKCSITDKEECNVLKDNNVTELEKSVKNIIEGKIDETSCINDKVSADANEDKTSNIVECGVDETPSISNKESASVNENVKSNNVECAVDETTDVSHKESADANESTMSITSKGSSSTRKSAKKRKKVSLPKTPDSNTSQDSPVFRQLRNRSVKVSTKKK